MVEILGVDFSGAAPDNNTWVAVGTLVNSTLELRECFPANRNQVTEMLLALPDSSWPPWNFPSPGRFLSPSTGRPAPKT